MTVTATLHAVKTTATNELTLTINTDSPGENAAPAAFWFDATITGGSAAAAPGMGETYDPLYHEIIYDWTFGDASNDTPQTTLALPSGWLHMDKGYGRRVAHCYNDAGDYTVTCYAYEPATQRFGSTTTSVSVASSTTAFPTTRTIIYDPPLTADTSAYSGAQVFATWAEVITARDLLGATTAQILFAPGVALTMDAATAVIDAAGWGNIRILPLDPDNVSRPSIAASERQGSNQSDVLIKDWEAGSSEVVIGVDLVGEWDSTTELGPILSPFSMYRTANTAPDHLFLMTRCSATGFKSLYAHSEMPTGKVAYELYSEVSVTNWQDYGIIAGEDESDRYVVAAVGCSILQDVDALSGGPKNGLFNNHGALRIFSAAHSYVFMNDMFGRCGWSPGGGYGANLFLPHDNPTLRINTTANPDVESYVGRCRVEGRILYLKQGSPGDTNSPGNHILREVIQLAGSRQSEDEALVISYGGFSLDTFLCAKSSKSEAGGIMTMFVGLNNGSSDADNADAGVRLRYATFIDLRDYNAAATGTDVVNYVAFPAGAVTDYNNLLQQPNLTGATQDGTNTFDLGAVFGAQTFRHKGPRWGFMYREANMPSTISGSGGTLSIAYTEITDQIVYLDGGSDSGTPTSQAYWQLNEGTDTKHRLIVGGVTYHAAWSDFSVSFTDGTNIVITNNSGTDWTTGFTYQLQLDRSTRLPSTYEAQYDNTTDSLSGTVICTDSDTGKAPDYRALSYNDLLGVERVRGSTKRGAV